MGIFLQHPANRSRRSGRRRCEMTAGVTTIDELALADWRREVFALYARVRAGDDPRAAWDTWRRTRDRLFRSIPSRRSTPPARAAFGGLAVPPLRPGRRVTADVAPTAAAELEIETSTANAATGSAASAIARFALAGRPRAAAVLARGLRRRPVPAVRRRDERPRRRTAPAATCSTRSRAPTSAAPTAGSCSTSTSPTTRRASTTRRGRARWHRPRTASPSTIRAGERVYRLSPARGTPYPGTVPLYRLADDLPELRDAVLVASFDGWVDAAEAASRAVAQVAGRRRCDRHVRPRRRVRLPLPPAGAGRAGRAPVASCAGPSSRSATRRRRPRPADLLGRRARPALAGARRPTPSRWSSGWGSAQWVSLGAVPARSPHTRAGAGDGDRLTGRAAGPGEPRGPEGLLRVPSAALSAFEMAVTEAGTPAVGFYAQVPPYASIGYAAASIALLDRLGAPPRRLVRPRRRWSTRSASSAPATTPRWPATRCCARRSRGSSRLPATSRASSCPPATSSPARSSGSCAVGTTARTRKPAGPPSGRHGGAVKSSTASSAIGSAPRSTSWASERPAARASVAESAGIVNATVTWSVMRHVDGRIRVWDSICEHRADPALDANGCGPGTIGGRGEAKSRLTNTRPCCHTAAKSTSSIGSDLE